MNKLFLLLLLCLHSSRLLAYEPNVACPPVDWSVSPRYPEFLFPDSDRDKRPSTAEGQWMCFVGSLSQARAEQTRWVSANGATKNPDGSIAVDCDDNDPNRFMLVDVWPDRDGDGYTPRVNSEARCYAGRLRLGGSVAQHVFPEDEGYSIHNPDLQTFDCDDNTMGSTSLNYYVDKDGDGYGSPTVLGQFCASGPGRSSSKWDCNDNDSNILEAVAFGFPDISACGDFSIGLAQGRTDLPIHETDLGESMSFSIQTHLNGAIRPDARLACLENCPPWTISPDGQVLWDKVDLDGLPDAETGRTDFDATRPKKVKVRLRSSVGSIPYDGYSTEIFLILDYVPQCPDLLTFTGLEKAFKSGISQANIQKNEEQDFVVAAFKPVCPSTGNRVALKDLARFMKVDHFNWWQDIRYARSRTYTISRGAVREFLSLSGQIPLMMSRDKFVEVADGWVLDPQLNSGGSVMFRTGSDGVDRAWIVSLDNSDAFPYYWDEGAELAAYTGASELSFRDAPRGPQQWFELPGDKTQFILRVAGVKSDGTFVRWSKAYTWDSDWAWKTVSYVPFAFGKNVDPKSPAADSGSTTIGPIASGETRLVPALIGRAGDDASTLDYLAGSGFSYRIVGYAPGGESPPGTILSQNPPALSEVAQALEIEVVVAEGSGGTCGDIPNQGSTTRVRYRQAVVPFGTSCDAQKETQTGYCRDGILTFQGDATFESCSVEAPKDCDGLSHGMTTTRTRYRSAIVPFGASCEDQKEIQTGFCFNGIVTYTGSATSETCVVEAGPPPACEASIVKECKAGLLQSEACVFPEAAHSISKDETYRGSNCHEAPAKLTIFNLWKLVNSYSIKGQKVYANFGCKAKFKAKLPKTDCSP